MHDETPQSNTPNESASAHADTAPSAANGWDDASDADLLMYTRAGDGDAYGELWRRHSRAARTVARSFTSSLDPDDLVQESFAKIYQALQKGGGPTGAFRPYLFTTVRNTASAWGRARREASIDTLESFEDPASRDEETMAALDRSLTATAFRSLPTRWQEVLWYCEVEQMTPQQVAPLLAMKPNAVAALAYRAREGLRQAWIQAHIAAVPEGSEHRWTIERIGTYTRGSLGKRDAAKLESHLDSCARCTIVAAEAREVGSRIALVLLPLAAGTAGATGYLAWMQTGAHTAVATTAMPAAVLGGHGMGVGAGIDPSMLATLGTGGAGAGAGLGSGSGAGAAGSGASTTGAASTGAATTGAASAGVVTTGLVSGAISLVAATAVAAALALGPGLVSNTPTNIVVSESAQGSDSPPTPPTAVTDEPTSGPAPESTPLLPIPDATLPVPVPRSSTTPTTGPTAPPAPQPDPATPSQPEPSQPVRPSQPSEPEQPVEPEEPHEPGVPSQALAYTFFQGGHGQLYPSLSGVAEPGATIELERAGGIIAQTVVDEAGFWESPTLTDTPVGASTLTIRQITRSGAVEERTEPVNLAAPPTIVSPTDGATVSTSELDIEFDAIPGTEIYGRIDGLPAFMCSVAGGSGAVTCAWTTDWTEFGLGEHTIQVSYGEQGGLVPEAPARSIRVNVVEDPADSPLVDLSSVSSTGDAAPRPETRETDDSDPENAEPQPEEPENTAPENPALENTAPENTAPENTAPENTAPDDTEPEPVEPDSGKPENAEPDDTASDDTGSTEENDTSAVEATTDTAD